MKKFEITEKGELILNGALEHIKGKNPVKDLTDIQKLSLKMEKYLDKEYETLDRFLKDIKSSKVEDIEEMLQNEMILVSQS